MAKKINRTRKPSKEVARRLHDIGFEMTPREVGQRVRSALGRVKKDYEARGGKKVSLKKFSKMCYIALQEMKRRGTF